MHANNVNFDQDENNISFASSHHSRCSLGFFVCQTTDTLRCGLHEVEFQEFNMAAAHGLRAVRNISYFRGACLIIHLFERKL